MTGKKYIVPAFAYVAAVSLPSVKPLPQTAKANGAEIQAALAIVFSIVGAISLLIIVIAGFRFIASQGDPQKVAQAKSAIIYASVGLAVSILAVTIVGFVIGNLT